MEEAIDPESAEFVLIEDGQKMDLPLIPPKPNLMDLIPRTIAPPENHEAPDPDRFILKAKRLVVGNYNRHRNKRRIPELLVEEVYIISFTYTLGNWKAFLASDVAKGMLWEVSFNAERSEAYIEVYQKVNNKRVRM